MTSDVLSLTVVAKFLNFVELRYGVAVAVRCREAVAGMMRTPSERELLSLLDDVLNRRLEILAPRLEAVVNAPCGG